MMHFANPTSRGAAVGLAIWACLGCGLTVGTARLAPTRLSAQPHTQPQPQPPTQPRPQPPTQPRTQPQPVQLSLHDQYDRVHSLEMYRGRVLVLIYGDKQSQGINQPLGERLHVQFHPAARNLPPAQARLATPAPVAGQPPGAPAPDVVVIPVACVGKVPAAVRSIIRNQIRRGSPDVPVWLDFEDTMKLSFGLTEGTSNAVVFDTLGRYRYRGAAVHEPAAYQKLVQMIEQCRLEAISAPPPTPTPPTLPPTTGTATNTRMTTTPGHRPPATSGPLSGSPAVPR
jgi:hypothetical protein